ncbi:hypothetical protein [Magnetospirillum sp. 64-120]|uniref:hypothetical protein n=1 Tax=Magnetospirillum sp. 64-120 TaxID=1895778 RepID=UPI0025BE90F9|nr:hypothetical protein [Magnetospirillum sp. 64-120]
MIDGYGRRQITDASFFPRPFRRAEFGIVAPPPQAGKIGRNGRLPVQDASIG